MLRSWWAHAHLWGMNSDSSRSEWHIKNELFCRMGQWGPTKHQLLYDILYVCPFMCAQLWVICFARNGSKDNTEWIHGTQKESAAGYLQQRAAYGTLRPMYSMWWTTGWRHLIAIREYSTCLCVFWRNKRDGGNGCEGRERGFHRTSHRGCVSPAQLIVYSFIRANI